MDADDRAALAEILADLHAEEADQEADRGYASTHVSRAAAKLALLLEARGDAAPAVARAVRTDRGPADTTRTEPGPVSVPDNGSSTVAGRRPAS